MNCTQKRPEFFVTPVLLEHETSNTDEVLLLNCAESECLTAITCHLHGDVFKVITHFVVIVIIVVPTPILWLTISCCLNTQLFLLKSQPGLRSTSAPADPQKRKEQHTCADPVTGVGLCRGELFFSAGGWGQWHPLLWEETQTPCSL